MAALFTIAKTWNQPKCHWIKEMRYIYIMEYYAAIKKNEIMSFVGMWMELEAIILSKGTENQILHVLTYKWGLNDKSTWTH